jgi:hypothetical protein
MVRFPLGVDSGIQLMVRFPLGNTERVGFWSFLWKAGENSPWGPSLLESRSFCHSWGKPAFSWGKPVFSKKKIRHNRYKWLRPRIENRNNNSDK